MVSGIEVVYQASSSTRTTEDRTVDEERSERIESRVGLGLGLVESGDHESLTRIRRHVFTCRIQRRWEKQCFFQRKGSGTHYHIRIKYPCKIHLKYTNKQSLGRKGVGTASPRVPTEKALGKAWSSNGGDMHVKSVGLPSEPEEIGLAYL